MPQLIQQVGRHGRLARPCSGSEDRLATARGKGGQAAHGTHFLPWHLLAQLCWSTSLTTMRLPMISTTSTRLPLVMNVPSVTTST